MNASVTWWNRIKKSKTERDAWLRKQVFGEFQAYKRISELANKFNHPVLKAIAEQELNHATWLKEYCEQNFVNLKDYEQHEERYWKKIDMDFKSLEQACAVGAHAEKMRLDRIYVIANDTSDYPTLSKIFKKILKDELFHEKTFRELAGNSYEGARTNHEAGALALGLVV